MDLGKGPEEGSSEHLRTSPTRVAQKLQPGAVKCVRGKSVTLPKAKIRSRPTARKKAEALIISVCVKLD